MFLFIILCRSCKLFSNSSVFCPPHGLKKIIIIVIIIIIIVIAIIIDNISKASRTGHMTGQTSAGLMVS